MQKKVYILGDMLKKGNILLRQQETKKLRNLGFDVYSAVEEKDINDKSNFTVEENNKLAEKIYNKDMNAIRKSEYIIADVDNDSVGSTCEIGAIAEFNWFREQIIDIIYNSNDNLKENLEAFLSEYPKKHVFLHTSDIRHTDLPEIGMRRSFSINQFLHGACLSLNPNGIKTFDEILEDIENTDMYEPYYHHTYTDPTSMSHLNVIFCLEVNKTTGYSGFWKYIKENKLCGNYLVDRYPTVLDTFNRFVGINIDKDGKFKILNIVDRDNLSEHFLNAINEFWESKKSK